MLGNYVGVSKAGITTVWGLYVGASGFSMNSSGVGNLEAGLGLFGQNRLVFDMVYDVVNDVPSLRFGGLLAQGLGFSFCFRTDVRIMFDTSKSPVPFMVSVTFGGGPGFEHGQLR